MSVNETTVGCGALRKPVAKAAALAALALAVALSAGALAGCSSSAGASDDQGAAGTATQPTIGMTDFTTTTMDGGTFTNEDLADYKLTMVNIWSTTCHFCVEEMPGLSFCTRTCPRA